MTFNSIIPVYIIVILLAVCLCFTVFCISKKEFRHRINRLTSLHYGSAGNI